MFNFTPMSVCWSLKLSMWGGGHTAETDPTRNGWRAGPIRKGSDTLLVGRRGQPGCFLVNVTSSGSLDVCFHIQLSLDDVLALEARNAAGEDVDWDPAGDIIYKEYKEYPGWGLTVLQELRRLQKTWE